MPLHEAIRGFILNLLGEKMEEGVMRDHFYISADRFDWREAKPMEGQKLTAHRKWLDCWQNLALSDLHYFPTWEKEVHDVLQETFPDLTAIFSFYSKSIGGSTTAEDAVEMTMTEFKDLVKDVNLETKDLRFEQMQVLFMKANALNSEEAHAQRAAEKLDKESKLENARAGGNKLEGKKAPARRASASAAREDEKDQELVLYEFIALLVRISFWRANPYHGIHKLATTLIPFPECLRSMLHEVVLPLAQRDDSALFKDKLAEDEDMQAALTEYKERLKVWFNKETQSMHLCGDTRKIKYEQWQEVLKKGKVIGIWEVHHAQQLEQREQRRVQPSLTAAHPPLLLLYRFTRSPTSSATSATASSTSARSRCRRRSSPSSTRSRSTRSAPASPPTTPTRRRSTGTSSSSASRATMAQFSQFCRNSLTLNSPL